MARFKTLTDGFLASVTALGQAWRTENSGWQDEQARQFSIQVMWPVSSHSKKIYESLEQMDAVLSRMAAEGLIDEK